MLDAVLRELTGIVLRFIESDNMSDVEVLEYLKVVFWRVSPSLQRVTGVYWPHKSKELSWDYEV